MTGGIINIPPGGRLPPAPTFQAPNGDEVKAKWVDISVGLDYPNRVYQAAIVIDRDWRRQYAKSLVRST